MLANAQRGDVLVSVFINGDTGDINRSGAIDWWKRQSDRRFEIITDTMDLSRANGEYILVTTPDDVYKDDFIADMAEIFAEQKPDILFFNAETHWESMSDSRMNAPVNYAFNFTEYTADGRLRISSDLFWNINSYLGACLIRRDFLGRNKLLGVPNVDALVRQCLMFFPKAHTIRRYYCNHLIRIGVGNRRPNDFLSRQLDEYNYLLRFVKKNRKVRLWYTSVESAIRMFTLHTSFGDLAKVVPLDHIPQCSIHLVDHCNLNCKSCSHFSCLARAGDFELDINDFKRDVRQLRRVTRGKIKILELYGGEPLLHPNVLPFMKYARKYFPRATVRFITNGILLPRQKPAFWRAAHRYKITICPTRYPINVDWATVNDLAKRYRVIFDFFGGTGHWQKTMYHKPLDINGEQNGASSFINCQHSRCINLYKGRLYHCPVAAYIKYFNRQFKTNLKLCDSDSLDIHQPNLTPGEVFNFCARPIPFCRYCMTQKTTRGHPWGTTKKDISEWTLLRRKA